ncbi:hypothetical protein ABPG75_014044 [Micractinium tetrahymenae]
MAAPPVVQTEQGLQVEFSCDGVLHIVGPPLTASEADLVCDVLAVKAAVDAGQPLEGSRALRSLTSSASLQLSDAALSGLHTLGPADLAQQLQACSQHEYWRLAQGADAEQAEPPAGCRLLQGAAALGHSCLVQLLLALAPTAASPDSRGETPLHAAAGAGQLQVMELLLASVPSLAAMPVAWEGSDASSPLRSAASSGEEAAARLLLRVMPGAAAVRDGSGCTPLHAAIDADENSLVRLLLEAAPAAALSGPTTPLHTACYNLNLEAAQLLLQAAPQAAAMQDEGGSVPLQLAADACEERFIWGNDGLNDLAQTASDLILLLLQANPAAALAVDAEGKSPLHHLAAVDSSAHQAKEMAQEWLGGGQRGRPTAGAGGAEALAGDKQPTAAAGGGWMGTAERFVEGQMGSHAVPAQHGEGAGSSGASGLAGMAQQFLGGEGTHPGTPAEGAAGAGGGGSGAALMGMAQQFMGGQGGGGSSARAMLGAAQAFMGHGGSAGGGAGSMGEGGAADAGLVDKLLTVYQATHGKQFGGSEGEYDQLSSLAHSALGTPIGRDLLKSWVKQRLGI